MVGGPMGLREEASVLLLVMVSSDRLYCKNHKGQTVDIKLECNFTEVEGTLRAGDIITVEGAKVKKASLKEACNYIHEVAGYHLNDYMGRWGNNEIL